MKSWGAVVGGIDGGHGRISSFLFCFGAATRGIRNSGEFIELSGQLLSVLLNFAEPPFRRRGHFFEWRRPRFNCSRGPEIGFVESTAAGDQFARRSAVSVDFE